MTSLELEEAFACPYLHGVINRRSCAARHRSFAGKGTGRTYGKVEGITGCCCRRCPIGAEHARGRRPDVKLVHVVRHPASAHNKPARCIGCSNPIPVRIARGGRAPVVCGPACGELAAEYSRNVERLSLPDWA